MTIYDLLPADKDTFKSSAFYCCIMFFCQLTAILVTALLNATAETASDNREFTRVFHQIISP